MDYLTGAACSLPLLYASYQLAGSVLDDHFVHKYTVLPDLAHLAQPREDSKRIKGTAVICGGRWVELTLLLWVSVNIRMN